MYCGGFSRVHFCSLCYIQQEIKNKIPPSLPEASSSLHRHCQLTFLAFSISAQQKERRLTYISNISVKQRTSISDAREGETAGHHG